MQKIRVAATVMCALSAAVLLGAATNPKIQRLVERLPSASLQEQVKIAKQIIAIDESYGDAYVIIGHDKYLRREYGEAVADLSKATKLESIHQEYLLEALKYRTHCFIELGDYNRAFQDCRWRLKLDENAEAAKDLSSLYKKFGDVKKSEEYANLALRLEKSGHGAKHRDKSATTAARGKPSRL